MADPYQVFTFPTGSVEFMDDQRTREDLCAEMERIRSGEEIPYEPPPLRHSWNWDEYTYPKRPKRNPVPRVIYVPHEDDGG